MTDPDRRLKQSLRDGRRRARELGLPHELVTPAALQQRWRCEGIDAEICRYCFGPSEHLDHDYPFRREGSPGHVVANIVPACGPCNRAKQTKTADEFLRESFYWRFQPSKELAHA